MDITFTTSKLERIFNSEHRLRKRYGARVAKSIALRLAVLKHARTLSRVPATPPDRRHALTGKRKGQYAVDLVHPHRLVFEPRRESGETGSPDPTDVTAITIIKVVDYH